MGSNPWGDVRIIRNLRDIDALRADITYVESVAVQFN